jgi:hypothetical protein
MIVFIFITNLSSRTKDWRDSARLKGTVQRKDDFQMKMCIFGAATIRATQYIINASYNQRQRFFHLSPEPRML